MEGILYKSILVLGFSFIFARFLLEQPKEDGWKRIEFIKNRIKGLNTVDDFRRSAAKQKCKNSFERPDMCNYMAADGNCIMSPGWATVMCAASCNTCDLLDAKKRCDPKEIGYDSESEISELHTLFTTFEEKWGNKYNISVVSRDPFIVYIDDFLTTSETNLIINQGTLLGLKRSTDQGEMDEKTGIQQQVKSQSRTSENAWCMNECENNPIIKNIYQRISDMTMVPKVNFESMQILRYTKGQEYKTHHDMALKDLEMLSGPRILTFFLYLSDVEEGGETFFPQLDLKVKPKRGSAVLWPSVMLNNTHERDDRTMHAALPVQKGIKYGSNIWIHSKNTVTPIHFGW